jgi:hypothetical protein
MKKFVLLLGLVTLVSLLTSAAYSDPSSQGATGILNVPTAEVVPTGQFDLLVAYDSYKMGDLRLDTFPEASLDYGFRHGEVGVSYFHLNGYDAVKGGNAKYIFVRESKNSPSIAAGILYSYAGPVSETDLYLVATDSLGWGPRVRTSAGVLYQKADSSDIPSNVTGMVGMEIGSVNKTTLGVDYILHDMAAGSMFGATLRQPLTPHLTAQVGVGNSSRYFVGMTVKFGV